MLSDTATLSENEGHILLFIESNLSIPTPRLCAMYRDAGNLYIVTEYIPEKDLENLWSSLSKHENDSLAPINLPRDEIATYSWLLRRR